MIVTMFAIKRCTSYRKTFSPPSPEQGILLLLLLTIYITVIVLGGNQEDVDEIVNKPNTSLLNGPSVAPNRYGGTSK